MATLAINDLSEYNNAHGVLEGLEPAGDAYRLCVGQAEVLISLSGSGELVIRLYGLNSDTPAVECRLPEQVPDSAEEVLDAWHYHRQAYIELLQDHDPEYLAHDYIHDARADGYWLEHADVVAWLEARREELPSLEAANLYLLCEINDQRAQEDPGAPDLTDPRQLHPDLVHELQARDRRLGLQGLKAETWRACAVWLARHGEVIG